MNIGFIGGGVNSAIGNTHFCASTMDNKFKLVAGCFSRDEKVNKEKTLTPVTETIVEDGTRGSCN